ncbi:hypothetical protein GEMRC1_003792 [Eukaryota sp. GEM-RC1]
MTITADQLTQLFNAVQSGDQHLRESAEKSLFSLHKTPNLLPTLLQYISDPKFTVNQRILACVSAKQAVVREWRISTGAIPDSDKSITKQVLPDLFLTDDLLLCDNIADVAAKIMRKETLKSWPEFPSILVQRSKQYIQENKTPTCFLLGLSAVVRELSSMCLSSDRRLYYSLSISLTSDLLSIIASLIPKTDFQSTSIKNQPLLICLSTVQTLLDTGVCGSDDESVPSLLRNVVEMTIMFVSNVTISPKTVGSASVELVLEVVQGVLSINPVVLDQHVKNFLVYALQIMSTWPKVDELLYSTVCNFISDVIISKNRLRQIDRDVNELFSQSSLVQMFTHLVCYGLSPFYDSKLSDLIDVDPEEFHRKSIHDPPLFLVGSRNLVSVLFAELEKESKAAVFEVLGTQFPNLTASREDFELVKKIDGILELLSLGAHSFFGKEARDLIPVLQGLSIMVQHEHPAIRRRIGLLIAAYSFVVAGEEEFLKTVFELFNDSNLLVRFASWEALHALLTEHQSVVNHRQLIDKNGEFLIKSMVESVKELSSDELLKRVCNLIMDISTILKSNILNFLEPILSLAPTFCSRSSIKSEFIALLKRICFQIGSNSPILWSISFTIFNSVFPSRLPDSLEVEDCTQLYLALLRNCPSSGVEPSSVGQLLSFIQHIPKLLNLELRLLPVFMQVIFAAALLGGPEFCKQHCTIFAKILEETVKIATDRAVVMVLTTFDLLLLFASSEICNHAQSTLIEVFSTVIEVGQGEIDDDISAVLIAGFSSLGCRLLYSNPPLFMEIIKNLNNQLEWSQNFFYFLSTSLEYFDVVLDYHKQKVIMSAVLFALENDDTGTVFSLISPIVSSLSTLLSSQTESDPNREVFSFILHADDDLYDEDEMVADGQLPENERKSQLLQIDPIISLDLKSWSKRILPIAISKFPAQWENLKSAVNERQWDVIMS